MTSSGPPVSVTLSSRDAAAVEVFRCARGTPWSEAAERLVHDLATELAAGSVRAFGIWEDAELVAVAIHQRIPLMPENWRLRVVAVRLGHERHGYATTLIREVADLAESEGALYLSGVVFYKNTPSLDLLVSLGADPFPRDEDGEVLAFVLPLPL